MNIDIYFIVAPVLVGLIEFLKAIGLKKELSWTVAVLIGTAYGLALDFTLTGAVAGLALGLMSSGFYDGAKQAINQAKALLNS